MFKTDKVINNIFGTFKFNTKTRRLYMNKGLLPEAVSKYGVFVKEIFIMQSLIY